MKSIFAQMLNSIVIPVITNLYIENNLYEANGLVFDVFNLAITSAFLPPLLKFIDIPFILQKLEIWKYRAPCKFALTQFKNYKSIKKDSTKYTNTHNFN